MPIVKVKHIRNFILELTFSNKETHQIDLKEFMMKAENPMISKYRIIDKFKNVKLVQGYLSWGEENEFDLSGEQLYQYTLKKTEKV